MAKNPRKLALFNEEAERGWIKSSGRGMSKALDEVTQKSACFGAALVTHKHPTYIDMRATKQFRLLFICGAFRSAVAGRCCCWKDQSAEGCRRRGQSCAREREALTLQRFLLLGPIAKNSLALSRERAHLYVRRGQSLRTQKSCLVSELLFQLFTRPGTDSQERLSAYSARALCKFDFLFTTPANACGKTCVLFFSASLSGVCGAFHALQLHSC